MDKIDKDKQKTADGRLCVLFQLFAVFFPFLHQPVDLDMHIIDLLIQLIHLLEIMIIFRFEAQLPQRLQLRLFFVDMLHHQTDRRIKN